MPLQHLTNFEIQNYYKNKPYFNGVYSRNYLPKIRDGAYVINLDEYKQERIGKLCMLMVITEEDLTMQLTLTTNETEHIPKEIKKFINNKNIIKNAYRTQAYENARIQPILYWIY